MLDRDGDVHPDFGQVGQQEHVEILFDGLPGGDMFLNYFPVNFRAQFESCESRFLLMG